METTSSKAVEFIYQDTEIHNLFSDDDKVMVNATEMAKIFGKRTDVFLKADHVKAFIEVAILTPNGGRIGIKTKADLISNQSRNGIYFHRILALKFAAWLDPQFEVWIYSKIEEVLFGKAKNVGSKISEAERKKQQIIKLTKEVRESGNETAIALLDNLEDLKKIEREKKKSLALFSSQFKMDF